MESNLEQSPLPEGKSIEEPPERLSSAEPEMKELLDKHSQDESSGTSQLDSDLDNLDFGNGDIYDSSAGDSRLPVQEGTEADAELLVDDPLDKNKKYLLPSGQADFEVGSGVTTMDKLAEQVHGEGLSQIQKETFARAVRELNGGVEKPEPGKSLKLPGVNEDGDFYSEQGSELKTWWTSNSFEVQYEDGSRVVHFDGGRQVFESANQSNIPPERERDLTVKPDGTRIERFADGRVLQQTIPTLPSGEGVRLFMVQSERNGELNSNVRGNRPENNFNLQEGKDGSIVVKDQDDRNPLTFIENDTVSGDRQALLELVKKEISDPLKLAKFKADMIRFEHRVKNMGLPESEISETYKSIGRLLEDDPKAVISQEDRSILAQQVISQAAHPISIDQGQNKTCNVSNAEVRIYARQPSKAADLVADAALTGKYKGTDGTEVQLRQDSLIPDREARMNPPLDGNRSFATQLFNHTAANLVLKDSGRSYIKTRPARPLDTGERVVDADGNEVEFTGFTGDEIVKAHNIIAGPSDDIVYIDHTSEGHHKGDNRGKFSTEENFKDLLVELKEKGGLPVILMVDAGIQPFSSTFQESGSHVVTVHDIDKDTGLVKVDNQWGSNKDFVSDPVSIEQLYRATSLTQFRNDFVKDIFDKNPDRPFDLNFLDGLEQVRNGLNIKADFDDGGRLGHSVIVKANRRWTDEKAAGTFDSAEASTTRNRIDKIYNELSPRGRLKALWASSGEANHVYSEDELVDMYATVASELYIDPATLERALTEKVSGLDDNTKKLAGAMRFLDDSLQKRMLDRIKQG